MMYLLLLWFFFILICILSIINTTMIITKIIHVSSGSSVLDIDAPIGIRLRKWFFLIIAFSNLLRFLSMFIFLVYYLRNDFSRNKMWYLPLNEVGKDTIFWQLINSPISLVSLLMYSFLADYIGEIYHSLNGSQYRYAFRMIWIVLNGIFCGLISAWMIYSWFQSNSNDYYHTQLLPWNFGLLGMYSICITGNLLYYSIFVIRFLLNSSYSNPSKIIARLLTLVVVVSSVSLYYTVIRIVEFVYYNPNQRVLYGQYEIITILVSESLCSLLIILIITNGLSNVESRIRNRLPTRRRMEISSSNPSTTNNGVTRPFAMTLRGYQSIPQDGNGV